MSESITLGDVLAGIETGKSFQTSEILARPDELGVLKVSAVSWADFLPNEAKALSGDYLPAENHRVKQGDLLISRANTRELVGAVVRVERDYPMRLLSDKTLRLIIDENSANKDYLLFALRSPQAREHIEHFATGTSDSMRNISQDVIKAVPLWLPSLPEQRQIAARLKAQLAFVATARQAAQVQLREAVLLQSRLLTAAFDQLTCEPTTLGSVLNDIQTGKSFQTAEVLARPDELGVLKVSAVSWSEFRADQAKLLKSEYQPAESHRVKAGDLLISRANTRELVGAVVLVDRDYPMRLLSDKTLRLIIDESCADKNYLLFALRTELAREHIELYATGTSDSMRNISQDVIASTPILLPPVDTQHHIVTTLKQQLAEADALRAALEQQLRDLDALPQRILAQAFDTEGASV